MGIVQIYNYYTFSSFTNCGRVYKRWEKYILPGRRYKTIRGTLSKVIKSKL